MQLALIGGGNMGSAILRALVEKQTFVPDDVLLVEPDRIKRVDVQETTGCRVLPKLNDQVGEYAMVLLAVKPQNASVLMETLAPLLTPEQLVISVMAGWTLESMRNSLRHDRLVRVMTNTPAQIGEGMSVFFAEKSVGLSERDKVKLLFSSCGQCIEVGSEDAIDAATAVSGSGPAYMFYLGEQMMSSAESLGFTEADAQLLVRQTLLGSALLWLHRGATAGELKRQVTSPGGTTEAALACFESGKVGEHLRGGIRAAYQRAKELSGE